MALAFMGFALIIMIDLVPLFRRRSVRGVIAFLFILLPAMALTFLRIKKIEVPSLMKLIGDFMKAWGISY